MDSPLSTRHSCDVETFVRSCWYPAGLSSDYAWRWLLGWSVSVCWRWQGRWQHLLTALSLSNLVTQPWWDMFRLLNWLPAEDWGNLFSTWEILTPSISETCIYPELVLYIYPGWNLPSKYLLSDLLCQRCSTCEDSLALRGIFCEMASTSESLRLSGEDSRRLELQLPQFQSTNDRPCVWCHPHESSLSLSTRS